MSVMADNTIKNLEAVRKTLEGTSYGCRYDEDSNSYRVEPGADNDGTKSGLYQITIRGKTRDDDDDAKNDYHEPPCADYARSLADDDIRFLEITEGGDDDDDETEDRILIVPVTGIDMMGHRVSYHPYVCNDGRYNGEVGDVAKLGMVDMSVTHAVAFDPGQGLTIAGGGDEREISMKCVGSRIKDVSSLGYRRSLVRLAEAIGENAIGVEDVTGFQFYSEGNMRLLIDSKIGSGRFPINGPIPDAGGGSGHIMTRREINAMRPLNLSPKGKFAPGDGKKVYNARKWMRGMGFSVGASVYGSDGSNGKARRRRQ